MALPVGSFAMPLPVGSPINKKVESQSPRNEYYPALLKMQSAGIFLTGLLPFSSRGIIINVLKAPFYLIYYLGMGFSQKVKGLSVNALVDLKQALGRNWEGGIQDHYKDLSTLPYKEAMPIIHEGIRYSQHQYNLRTLSDFPKEKENVLKEIDEKLKALGFTNDVNVFGDRAAAYYSIETGTMFNLSFDKDKKEFILCFWGLGNEIHLNTDSKTNEVINSASVRAAVGDFVGLVHPAAIQAIKVGEILVSEAKKLEWTPVIVGHSHGGGLAQCAAIANDVKGVVFNSRPMGAGMRRFIGQDDIAERARNITAFSVGGDFLTGNKILNFLSIIFERVTGIIVPRTVGQGYYVPSDSRVRVPHVGYDNALNNLANDLQSDQGLLGRIYQKKM